MMSPPNEGIELNAFIMVAPEVPVGIKGVASVPNNRAKDPETGTDLVTTTELVVDKKTLCPAAGRKDKEVNERAG